MRSGEKGSQSTPNTRPSEGVRSSATLFIVVHFFCVFVVIAANYSPSPVQSRLVEVFAPYTQTLNFELNYTPYHLTHASDQDVDHRLELLVGEAETDLDDEAEVWRVVSAGWRGGERYKRYQRLAAVMSFFRQDDAMSGRIARSAASGLLHHNRLQAEKLRCRKHFLMPWDRYGQTEGGDPNSEAYFQTVYSANVLIGESGFVDVVKIAAPREVARPRVKESQEP